MQCPRQLEVRSGQTNTELLVRADGNFLQGWRFRRRPSESVVGRVGCDSDPVVWSKRMKQTERGRKKRVPTWKVMNSGSREIIHIAYTIDHSTIVTFLQT
jgi:hypothetical protein